MAFMPLTTPKSLLGRHRFLAPSASVRVNPLSLSFQDCIVELRLLPKKRQRPHAVVI